MAQSPKMSLVEVIASRAISFVVGVNMNYWILPLFGFPVAFGSSIVITMIFTLISVAVAYGMRRFFENLEQIKQAIRDHFRSIGVRA